MDTSEYTDDELIEQIARGDWGVDATAPRLDTVTRLVAQRQRRRRTTIGVSVTAGLTAAAATIAVLIGLPSSTPTNDDDLAAQTPTASATEPATARTTRTPPRFPACTSDRLLLADGPYAGTPQRPVQSVFFQNIGKATCVFVDHPVLSIGTKNGGTTPVDMTSADNGPWTLQPNEALVYTVTAPRPSSCVQVGGVQRARQFMIEEGAFTSTFNFPGMRVENCGAPVLTGMRVGTPPPN